MKKLFISMLIAVLPFCSSVKDALAANDPTLITTVNGPIKGTEEGDLLAWRGLPYAKPPVGNLRWMPPQPPEKWKELLITTKYKQTCAQNADLGPFSVAGGSEDCLGNDSNLLIVFYVQIMPDDLVMQLHRF